MVNAIMDPFSIILFSQKEKNPVSVLSKAVNPPTLNTKLYFRKAQANVFETVKI